MTEPWKPQPGKPAMTRDEKTLVTDLNFDGKWFWSDRERVHFADADLTEPTAAILAAHGIDADGKPVEPSVTPEEAEALCAARPPIFVDVHTFYDGGKSLEPDAPTPSTRVDDRWFEAAKDFTGAIIINEGTNNLDQSFDVKRAARYADALMAEVAKREGR